MKYYLIVGEASGDLHASHLMEAIKQEDACAEFRFFGGDLMREQGGSLVKHYREMAYMGFVQVIKHLPTILRNMKMCKEDLTSFKPDVVILVDYPSFNLKIAKFVKENLQIPVYYYISPKIWAWKEYRIKQIKAYVDKMYCILPFEVDFYKKHNYPVEYVGNPSVDELANKQKLIETSAFKKENELSNKPIVSLLAGSRKAEVAANLPKMLQAMRNFPNYQPVVAGAPGLSIEDYATVVDLDKVKVVFGKTFDLLLHSEAAIVTSGTATLETALLNVPQVVCYHVAGGKLSYYVMSKMLKIRFVSLVNLIQNDALVTELLGYRFTVEHLIQELEQILPGGKKRETILTGYKQMCLKLGEPGAAKRCAASIVKSLERKKPS